MNFHEIHKTVEMTWMKVDIQYQTNEMSFKWTFLSSFNEMKKEFEMPFQCDVLELNWMYWKQGFSIQ